MGPLCLFHYQQHARATATLEGGLASTRASLNRHQASRGELTNLRPRSGRKSTGADVVKPAVDGELSR